MFKTLIMLYALNFWVIECTPNPGRYSRTGWRPCVTYDIVGGKNPDDLGPQLNQRT